MNKQKILISAVFLFALILSVNLVLGANEASVTSAPVTGANLTKGSSPTFNCSSSGTGLVYSILNATFYYNLSGTDTVIGTLTNTSSELNASIAGTLSLASTTAGLNYKISCKMCNASNCYAPTLNATSVDIYTSTPACAFSTDYDTTNWMSPIGVATTQSSTKDALSSITYNWTLTRPDGTVSKSSTSSAPTFTGSDFDVKGTFTLALTVKDDWANSATCTSKSIFVKGSDGTGATVAQSTVSTQTGGNQVSMLVWIIIGVTVIGAIVVVSFFVIELSKKKRR